MESLNHLIQKDQRLLREFKGVQDSFSIQQKRISLEAYYADRGFVEFSIDTFHIQGDSLLLQVHKGPQYFYENVFLGGINELTYQKAGFEKVTGKRYPFTFDDFEERLGFTLEQYQNNGFPFAAFDSLKVGYKMGRNDSMLTSLKYAFESGVFYKIDTVEIVGEKREKDSFIEALIGIRKGDIYNQSEIDNIPRVLNNSIYFQNVKAPEISFDEKTAKLSIKLEKRKSGKFDLLIGLLPPREGEGQKFQFTGLADFQLVSPLFKAGEIIRLRFDKLPGSSQKLIIGYLHPNILGTQLKAEFDFNLLKQDTSFLNRYFRLAAHYAFTQNLSINAWYKNKNSALISTTLYENDSVNTPPVLDGSDQTWGFGFVFQNLDYRFNPTKGIDFRADFGLGTKKIKKNLNIHEDIYENLDLNIPKRETDIEIDYYKSLFKKQVLHLGGRLYWLDQDQYFENDLLQVGGAQSLRGFNENEFFARLYLQGTIEYRYLLEKNSYLLVFGDFAYLENPLAVNTSMQPFGVGIGMAYETAAGIISITYAVGKVEEVPFQPSRGRIHIGLVNQF